MIAYHGSTVQIQHPDIMHSKKYLDFGRGFYITTYRQQAEKYKEAEDEVIEKLAIGRAQNENGEGIPFDEAMRRMGLSYGKPNRDLTHTWRLKNYKKSRK